MASYPVADNYGASSYGVCYGGVLARGVRVSGLGRVARDAYISFRSFVVRFLVHVHVYSVKTEYIDG